MPFIASTLTNSQNFTEFNRPDPEGKKVARPATPRFNVVIKGGAQAMGLLHTPQGVITEVSDEQLSFLEGNKHFKRHVARGNLKVLNRNADGDKVASSMAKDTGEVKDGMRVSGGSAPLSAAHGDFEEGGRASGVAPTDESAKII